MTDGAIPDFGPMVQRQDAAFVPIYRNFKMFWVYILRSELNNIYYIGSCRDVRKRLLLHNRGLVVSTKRYIPWKLIYFEKHFSLKSARSRELQIKKWKSRISIENLIKHSKISQ